MAEVFSPFGGLFSSAAGSKPAACPTLDSRRTGHVDLLRHGPPGVRAEALSAWWRIAYLISITSVPAAMRINPRKDFFVNVSLNTT